MPGVRRDRIRDRRNQDPSDRTLRVFAAEGGYTVKTDEYLRYLGVLGLLAECSVYVPEEQRECIERAFKDACEAHPKLRWRRMLNRLEIGPHDEGEEVISK